VLNIEQDITKRQAKNNAEVLARNKCIVHKQATRLKKSPYLTKREIITFQDILTAHTMVCEVGKRLFASKLDMWTNGNWLPGRRYEAIDQAVGCMHNPKVVVRSKKLSGGAQLPFNGSSVSMVFKISSAATGQRGEELRASICGVLARKFFSNAIA
jgi:hypothetical protein